jgi:hypothetical protein
VRPAGAAAAAVVFGVLPPVLLLALPSLHGRSTVKYFAENVFVPVDPGFSVDVRGGTVSWRAPSAPVTDVFYRVFRSRPVAPAPDPTLPPGRDGIRCLEKRRGAADCRLEMSVVGVTRASRFRDDPPPGRWVYRVGLLANWKNDRHDGDVMVLSRAARVSTRPR